jgi:Fe-S-cluster containining protein
MTHDDDPRRAPIDAEALEDGLRFLHIMGMQSKQTIVEANARSLALVEALSAAGALDMNDFLARLERTTLEEEARAERSQVVQVAQIPDKYALQEPDIDCAARLHLCQARCCTLRFPLSFQDLDEGVIRWAYREPYQIRQRDDGYCVHNCPSTRGCTAYQHRPGVCRTYDCRKDARIWSDFDARIPAAPRAPRPDTPTP